jgi:predicted enzyme related to lactoylglutathione lyase
MVFVDDPRTAARWWADHLGGHAAIRSQEGFYWYEVGGIEVGFHPADDLRNARGGCPVMYWAVTELEAERARLLASGCRAHRGPLTVDATRTICQLVDPFGNVFGLDAG